MLSVQAWRKVSAEKWDKRKGVEDCGVVYLEEVGLRERHKAKLEAAENEGQDQEKLLQRDISCLIFVGDKCRASQIQMVWTYCW